MRRQKRRCCSGEVTALHGFLQMWTISEATRKILKNLQHCYIPFKMVGSIAKSSDLFPIPTAMESVEYSTHWQSNGHNLFKNLHYY